MEKCHNAYGSRITLTLAQIEDKEWEQRRRDREAALNALILLDSAPLDDPDRFILNDVPMWRKSRIKRTVLAVISKAQIRTVMRGLIDEGYISAEGHVKRKYVAIRTASIDVQACREDLADGVDVA